MQIYPILLSALSSINQQQLTINDVGYALNFCLSPLMFYLVIASFGDLFGVKTGLYKRITSHRRDVRVLVILVPFLWLALYMTASLSGRAFEDSGRNQESFGHWIYRVFLIFVWTFLLPGAFAIYVYPIFVVPPALVLFRRRSQVMVDVRTHLNGVSNLRGRLRVPWVFLKCAWCVLVTMDSRFVKLNSIKAYHRPLS